tara:strand:- start:62 stop:1012 length:951 start_codon:yes stop_codon:yes gene_type:complete
MRIAVLGVGSIGGLILGALSKTEHHLIAVSRGETALRISAEGMVLHHHNGPIEMIPPGRFEIVDTMIDEEAYSISHSVDIAIICGKSGDTELLGRIARNVLASSGMVLSMQNGLGNVEKLNEIIGKERVLGGSTTHGAWKDDSGSIHWAGFGDITIGSLERKLPGKIETSLIQAFEDANLKPSWSENLNSSIWMKAIINVAINPICAIAGLENGMIESDPYLLSLSMAAASEAVTVARNKGIDFSDIDIENKVIGVIRSTSNNRCSMLQDLMSGRRTEIDSLCGRISEEAEAFGVPVPINTTLYALVKAIETANIE